MKKCDKTCILVTELLRSTLGILSRASNQMTLRRTHIPDYFRKDFDEVSDELVRRKQAIEEVIGDHPCS